MKAARWHVSVCRPVATAQLTIVPAIKETMSRAEHSRFERKGDTKTQRIRCVCTQEHPQLPNDLLGVYLADLNCLCSTFDENRCPFQLLWLS